jgi:hypothetical protein
MRENETVTVKPVKTLLPDQATAYIIVGVISLYFIASCPSRIY